MKIPWSKALTLAWLLWIAIALHGCGHGGTEVGNPPGPQSPTTGVPGSEDDGASPSPSPGSNLILEPPPDENEVAQNPEEIEP